MVEEYKGKFITVYMVYATSPDRLEGRSAAYDTSEQASKMVRHLEELGWSAYWLEQAYEAED